MAWHPCFTAEASRLPHICIEGAIFPPFAAASRTYCLLVQILHVSSCKWWNDATKHSAKQIATRYDGLIRDIRTRCPQSKIILSKVPPPPPRKGTSRTMSAINKINSSIDKFRVSIMYIRLMFVHQPFTILERTAHILMQLVLNITLRTLLKSYKIFTGDTKCSMYNNNTGNSD